MTGMTGILIIRLTITVRNNLIVRAVQCDGWAKKGEFQVHAAGMLHQYGDVFLPLHL